MQSPDYFCTFLSLSLCRFQCINKITRMHRIITELILYLVLLSIIVGSIQRLSLTKVWLIIPQQRVQAFVDTIQQYASDNLAKILVMIRDPYVQKIRREQAMTTTAFLANTGGLLGLCLGFSVISLAELVYHFLLKRYWCLQITLLFIKKILSLTAFDCVSMLPIKHGRKLHMIDVRQSIGVKCDFFAMFGRIVDLKISFISKKPEYFYQWMSGN